MYFELQFHTPESISTKEETCHVSYEAFRTAQNQEQRAACCEPSHCLHMLLLLLLLLKPVLVPVPVLLLLLLLVVLLLLLLVQL